MFNRAVQHRKRLTEEMEKKQAEQLWTQKKSSASSLQRALHFQRLSMPNAHTRAAAGVPRPRDGAATATITSTIPTNTLTTSITFATLSSTVAATALSSTVTTSAITAAVPSTTVTSTISSASR